MGNNLYRAEQFIKAIPGSGGIVTTIAQRVDCDWHTAKKYIDTMPTVQQAYMDECEVVLDRAESVLITSINEGDSSDAKWYLTKKGKHRGYVDSRQEITGAEGGDIKVDVTILKALDTAYADENED